MDDQQSIIEKSPHISKTFIVKLVIAIVLVFAALGLFELLVEAFQVVLLGITAVIWAVLFRGPADWICSKTCIKHHWATLLSVILVLGVMTGLGWLVFPSFIEEFSQFEKKIPEAINNIKEELVQTSLGRRLVQELESPQEIIMKNGGTLQNLVASFFSSLFGFLADVFIVIVVGFFLLADPHLYKRVIVKLFPVDRRPRVALLLTYQYRTLKSWLAGKLFDMFVVAALTTFGLWLLDIPLPIALGVIAGLISFIPNLGPIIALIPALLIAYLEGPKSVLYVFILYNSIQLIESNLLLPLIQQHQVSVPPAFILLGQVLLGVVAGVLGIILTVPILVLLMVFVKMIYLQDILGDPDVELQAKNGS